MIEVTAWMSAARFSAMVAPVVAAANVSIWSASIDEEGWTSGTRVPRPGGKCSIKGGEEGIVGDH